MGTVVVVDGDRRFEITPDQSWLFGRADDDGVVGLDPQDMGISARAGSIEFYGALWWVANHSAKRPLLIESSPGHAPQRLGCAQRHVISASPLTVLVPGAVYTHRLEVRLPDDYLSALRVEGSVATGTITLGEVALSGRDRDVLAAVCCGYLRPFPRRDPHPLTYQEAAELLGPPWTKVTVRKHIERLKERLGRAGLFLEGPHANHDLAEHLINSGLLTGEDLTRLPAPPPR